MQKAGTQRADRALEAVVFSVTQFSLEAYKVPGTNSSESGKAVNLIRHVPNHR
jgi:hypothetical protein